MVGPSYVRPAVEQPTGFKSQPAGEAGPPIAADWWRLYAEPELERLITSAQVSHQTLRQAVARVDEARALARVAGSYLYPTVSLDPSYSRTRYSGSRASTISGKQVARGVDVSNWTIPLDLSYEVDVWGRVRRSLEAARATAVATADDVGVVRLTIETDVAQYHYTIRALDAQIQILKETVTAYEEQVRLLSVQLRTGLVSGIVVSQAQAQLKATQAQLSNTARTRADTEHALAILSGRAAPSFTVASNPLQEVSPPVVPAGLPAQLLTRPPAVAEAEKNVAAANAQIGVATAEFYPRFMLTASAGFNSLNADMLFRWQSGVAQIRTSLPSPLFQGGRQGAYRAARKS